MLKEPHRDQLLREELASHPFPLLFATVGGEHLYGFPAPDSGYDLRGAHVLPLEQVVGLAKGPETVKYARFRDEVASEVVSQDLHRFIRLMLKRNGSVLEQVLSPWIVKTSAVHQEMIELGKGCITRHHVRHYLGAAEDHWKLSQKEGPARLNTILHVFRFLLTGLHLMQTGSVEANLVALNQQFRLGFLEDLVSYNKLARSEKVRAEEPRLDLIEKEYRRLLGALEIEGERTTLPEESAAAGGLHDLLVRVRLGKTG